MVVYAGLQAVDAAADEVIGEHLPESRRWPLLHWPPCSLFALSSRRWAWPPRGVALAQAGPLTLLDSRPQGAHGWRPAGRLNGKNERQNTLPGALEAPYP
jgi:hypothetical protein